VVARTITKIKDRLLPNAVNPLINLPPLRTLSLLIIKYQSLIYKGFLVSSLETLGVITYGLFTGWMIMLAYPCTISSKTGRSYGRYRNNSKKTYSSLSEKREDK
jgi:hypothetical protein